MKNGASSQRGGSRSATVVVLIAAVVAIALLSFGSRLHRLVRESAMQRVTSAHYEILFPAGTASPDAATDFAMRREKLFAAMDRKLGDANSNKEIRIVFDPEFPDDGPSGAPAPSYAVTGRTIRTKRFGADPEPPAAADAQILLNTAWGRPGNAELASWTALWLADDWYGQEVGMAAASVEQRLGHKTVAAVLAPPPTQISSSEDRMILGAAWLSEVAEFGGADAVRKLYSAKISQPTVPEIAKVLGTTPLELDRKWQMWMYAYLAGMPPMPQNSNGPADGSTNMPMNMPMKMQ